MKILAVDDEKIALEALEDALRKALTDSEICAFRTSAEALECAGKTSFNVAFLDIEMRDINGLELAKRLKDIKSDINIVFVTGYSEYALDALNLYVSGYILKPVTPEKVTDALAHLRTPVTKISVDNAAGTEEKKLRIQCFGSFEVFCGDEPLRFSRQRSKELLAYLIDRRGAQTSMAEIASVLWEDGQYNLSRNNQIHSFLHDMIATLDNAGVKNVIIRHRNALAVNISRIDCDFYR